MEADTIVLLGTLTGMGMLGIAILKLACDSLNKRLDALNAKVNEVREMCNDGNSRLSHIEGALGIETRRGA